MPRVRRYGNAVDGVVLLDKPYGISSNKALQQTKKLFNANKAGHTGSLDPLATGLLPICFGEATKFSQFLLDANKIYRIVIKLGIATTSGDCEGEIISYKEVADFNIDFLDKVLDKFRGNITQVPPMYSALKYQGQPLYKFARQGVNIDRKQREVRVNKLQLLDYNADNNTLALEVHCSKGTYMRSIAMDLGESLGCGGHIVQLRRLALGPYHIEKNKLDVLLSLTSILKGIRRIELTTQQAIDLQHGKVISCNLNDALGIVKVFANNKFLGIAQIFEQGLLKARRLLSTNTS